MTRLQKLLEKIHDEKLDALLVCKEANKRYLTGIGNLMGDLLVTTTESFLVSSARHTSFLQTQCPEFTVCHGGLSLIVDTCKGLSVNRIGYEEDFLTVNTYQSLSSAGCELVPSTKLLAGLRSIKYPDEIAAIRHASKISDAAFNHILNFIRPGLTEREVELELDYFMRKNGASYISFETLVSSGYRAYFPHSAATEKQLELGDLVLMDFGAMYEGYHADITRTIAVGKVDDIQRDRYNIVKTAQQLVLDHLQAGLTTGEADALARIFIETNSTSGCYDYGLGHGVGLEIHESPFMRPDTDLPLQRHQVVTVEPGIYISGWGGIRIEDTVLIEEHGCEVLTRSSKELIIV